MKLEVWLYSDAVGMLGICTVVRKAERPEVESCLPEFFLSQLLMKRCKTDGHDSKTNNT